MKINMNINNARNERFTIYCLVKITSLKTAVIKSYLEVDKYYPIIYDGLRYRCLDKRFDVVDHVTGNTHISEVTRVLHNHTTFEVIDILEYDEEDGYVVIKDNYAVDLV